MKKITWLMVLFLVFSCVGMGVQAQEALPLDVVTLSEDYRTAIWDGVEYQRFDASGVTLEMDDLWDAALTEQQLQTMKRIEVTAYNGQTVLELGIYFTDGAYLDVYYLRKDMMEDYTAIMSGQAENYWVDFLWPEGNTVQTSLPLLMGKEVTVTKDILDWCDFYDVFCSAGDGSLEIVAGSLLYCEGKYYYIDFSRNGIEYDGFYFYPGDHTSLSGWEVTDSGLVEELESALQANYSDGLGFLGNDSLTQTISKAFMVLVFGALPVGIFVLFLILWLRAKQTVYRKLFRIVWILAAAQAAVFAIVLMILW